MQIVTLLVLAISTSLDSLGVGVIYGLGGIRIRVASHLCICAVMMAITWGAVAAGNEVSTYLPEAVARGIGAISFSVTGIWILLPLMHKKPGIAAPGRDVPIDRAVSPVDLLKDPETADVDGSRTIELKEALLLGIALSVNNIFGGMSAGVLHINPFEMAALSVIFNVICLLSGQGVGAHFYATNLGRHAQVVSGIMMISLGLWQLR